MMKFNKFISKSEGNRKESAIFLDWTAGAALLLRARF